MTTQLPSASAHKYYPLQRAPPEIWGQIAANLPCNKGDVVRKGHIVQFSRTCRAFHELATPILYRDLRWFTHSSDVMDVNDIMTLGEVLERYPRRYTLVRSIRAFGDGDTSQGGSGTKNMLPLNRFTDLRSLDLRDIRVTPDTLQDIACLPLLRNIRLFWCSFCFDAGLPSAGSTSTSLRELNLAWPKVSLVPDTFFRLFPYLCILVLLVDQTQAPDVLRSLIDHNIPATLTSFTIRLETQEATEIFVSVLQLALHLEIIDLLSSSVGTIRVPDEAVPLLRVYKGPPRLASPFVKGRRIHTVEFLRLSEPPRDLEVYMDVLEQSSTAITTLVLHSLTCWNDDLAELIERYTPELCTLRIYYRRCINGQNPPDARFPRLPCLEYFHLDNVAVNEDEQIQQDLVFIWWTRCPRLQKVFFSDTRWTRGARDEWTIHRPLT